MNVAKWLLSPPLIAPSLPPVSLYFFSRVYKSSSSGFTHYNYYWPLLSLVASLLSWKPKGTRASLIGTLICCSLRLQPQSRLRKREKSSWVSSWKCTAFGPSCRFPNACLWFLCKIIYDDDFAGKSVAPFWRELENNYYLDGYLEQHGETLFTQLQSCWAWGMENEGRNIYLKSKPPLTTVLSLAII